MSFAEFVRAQEDSIDVKSEAPHIGDGSFNTTTGKSKSGPELKDIVVKFLVANMKFPDQREHAEDIFTRSLQCENNLSKPGDVCVFADYHSFDKEGNFTAVIKYAEFPKQADTTRESPESQETSQNIKDVF
jgi:hypothetical protein